jgi:hypothetical protein
VAHKLTNLQCKRDYNLLTLDIRGLYVSIPIKVFIHLTQSLLQYDHTNRIVQKQTNLFDTILQENYFQHNNKVYTPNKGVTMASPISGLMTEIYIYLLLAQFVKFL